MTQEDINEVMSKSLANYQLKQMAEDGGNLESALTLIYRLELELLNARAMRKGDFMTYKGRLKGWETMSKEERQEALEQMHFITADGEAVGYLVGDYLVGKVIDSCDEYINLEWWMPVGVHEATEEPVTTYSGGKWCNPPRNEDLNKGNIERIVACVNACQGITTEALKAGVISAGMDALNDKFLDQVKPFSIHEPLPSLISFDGVKIWEEA